MLAPVVIWLVSRPNSLPARPNASRGPLAKARTTCSSNQPSHILIDMLWHGTPAGRWHDMCSSEGSRTQMTGRSSFGSRHDGGCVCCHTQAEQVSLRVTLALAPSLTPMTPPLSRGARSGVTGSGKGLASRPRWIVSVTSRPGLSLQHASDAPISLQLPCLSSLLHSAAGRNHSRCPNVMTKVH